MKLKQRVIVTLSLFLTMSTLFIIGIYLGSPPPEDPKHLQQTQREENDQRVKGPEEPKKSNQRFHRVELPPLEELEKDPRFKSMRNHDDLLRAYNARLNHSRRVEGPPPIPMDRNLLHRPRDFRDSLPRDVPPEVLDKLSEAAQLGMRNNWPVEDVNRIPRHRLPDFNERLPREDNIRRIPPEVSKATPLQDQKRTEGTEAEGRQEPIKLPNRVSPEVAQKVPWMIWQQWVKSDYLYPKDAFWSEDMNHIINSMATAPITSFGLGSKGTQLKASLQLGIQKTVFKPMRYPRTEIIDGDPYAGFDRHNAEIAGFHLDGILDFRIAPPVVGRKLNLTALRPVTSEKLQATYLTKDGNTCFYGKCYYCKPSEAACADGDIMEGSVTLWLPEWYQLKNRRHPWQRTYRKGMKAKWETDDSYCQVHLHPNSEYYYGLLEITDTTVFDFLMGNADRHHYETYSEAPKHGRLMHIDNGKSFGNPYHDEMSILAPMMQCCRVRESTWEKLQSLQAPGQGPLSKILDDSLKRDPMYPILTKEHLEAVDRRHSILIHAIQQCIHKDGRDTVVVSSWG